MFELLSNVQTVPIDQHSLVMVHRGMNKVRVSVGEHSSEPSEVYITTGQSGENLESYIIFYMLEPQIRVVYGCDQNPYEPDQKEQVIEEAITFVEDMGSILEEVPWETMTLDQRSAWLEKEILYGAPVVEQLEELEELEEVEEIEAVEFVEIDDDEPAEVILENDDPEEVVVQEDADPEAGEYVVDISEDELQEALDEDGEDKVPPISQMDDEDPADTVSEPENIDEGDADQEDVNGIVAGGMEDVVIGEGDFDELLKQAFLKPDVVKKTKLEKGKRKPVTEDEFPVPEETADSRDDEWMEEEEADLSGAVLGLEVEKAVELEEEPEENLEEESEVPEVSEAAVEGLVDTSSEETVIGTEQTPAGDNNLRSGKNREIEVIRFLSRF